MTTKKLFLRLLSVGFLLSAQAYAYKVTQRGVTVNTKDVAHTTALIEQVLKLRHVDYAANGIHPVLVGIANNTNKPITISPTSFNVPVLTNQEIASRCWHKWKSVSLGFLVAGIVPILRDIEKTRSWFNDDSLGLGDQDSFWWALHKTFFSSEDYTGYSRNLHPMSKKVFYLGAVATPLYWWYINQYNKNIDNILQEFTLHQEEIIQPGEAIEKFVFFDAVQLVDMESFELHVHAHDEIALFAITK